MTPNPTQLPSAQRLYKATAVAIVVAGVILLTTVLPAEYGIDPTGVGKRLGLGVLANSAEATAATSPSSAGAKTPTPALDAVGQPLKPVEAGAVSQREAGYRTDTLSVVLAPGKGAEIKAHMQAGDTFVFQWTAGSAVAFDMHGERIDAAEGEYTSYWLERARSQASGAFTAPFDGSHGWYWKNSGTTPVTVTVDVSGFQQDLYRP